MQASPDLQEEEVDICNVIMSTWCWIEMREGRGGRERGGERRERGKGREGEGREGRGSDIPHMAGIELLGGEDDLD